MSKTQSLQACLMRKAFKHGESAFEANPLMSIILSVGELS